MSPGLCLGALSTLELHMPCHCVQSRSLDFWKEHAWQLRGWGGYPDSRRAKTQNILVWGLGVSGLFWGAPARKPRLGVIHSVGCPGMCPGAFLEGSLIFIGFWRGMQLGGLVGLGPNGAFRDLRVVTPSKSYGSLVLGLTLRKMPEHFEVYAPLQLAAQFSLRLPGLSPQPL